MASSTDVGQKPRQRSVSADDIVKLANSQRSEIVDDIAKLATKPYSSLHASASTSNTPSLKGARVKFVDVRSTKDSDIGKKVAAAARPFA